MLTSAGRWLGKELRRSALPLACYYTVALGVPLANGAGQSGAFFDHAVVVASVPFALVAVAAAVGACLGRVAGAVSLRRTVPPRMSAARKSGAMPADGRD